jgi:hypothetical protein
MTMKANDGDRLDRILQRDARAAIEDDGFTARVMGALPPLSLARRAPRRGWLGQALVLGSAALGSALAWIFAPGGLNVAQGFIDLFSRGFTPAAVMTLAMTAALLIAAVVLAIDTD